MEYCGLIFIPFWVTLCCVLFFGVLITIVYAYLLYLKWIFRHIPGPDPKWHFLGNIQVLRQCTKAGEYYHFQFLRWAEEHGPLYKVFFFHKVMLLSASAPVAKKILTNSRYQKSKQIYTRVSMACGKRFLGRGLVTNFNHKIWKHQRSCLNPAFQKKYLDSLILQFNEVADVWIGKLRELSNSNYYVDMSKMLARVTVDTIGKIAFNMDLKAIQSENNQFLEHLNTILEGMSIANKDPLMLYKYSYTKKVREVQHAVQFIRKLSRAEIERRMEKGHDLKSPQSDVVSLLIKSKEQNPDITIEDLVDDFITVFVAGQETTANALSFLLAEIGRNKKILLRLRNEVENIVGNSDVVTNEHLNQLPYMTQVWKEALRLYPPAPATVRDIPAKTTIEGHVIPIDSTLVLPFFVIHRMSKYYQEPEIFNPNRWAPNQIRHMYSYMPFSLGQRSCAGQQFARIESKILLCKFLQTFRFYLDMEQSFDIQEITTLKLKGGAKMKLIPI